MATKQVTPLMVIDVQPAYASAFGLHYVKSIIEEMRKSRHRKIVVVSVDEEFSGDSMEDIQVFWARHGMTKALFNRVQFVEKTYGFFRGWMDCGIRDDEIVNTARELRCHQNWDSRNMTVAALERVAPSAVGLVNPLYLPSELESNLVFREPTWNLCGGAAHECLKEMELWLHSLQAKVTTRSGLVYL
ncbi:MAG: hypothetical protein Q7S87_01340 [Agitococcus sp.]|nr:hypothetical protein [Agitococcus sp.]